MPGIKFMSMGLTICLLMGSIIGCSAEKENNQTIEPSLDEGVNVVEEPIAVEEPKVIVEPKKEQIKNIVIPDIVLSDTNNLTNPKATKEARIIHNYLGSIYGNYILSGQQESTWKGTPEYEMNYVEENTGRLPVIRGLDYINQDFDGVTQRSIEWWERGGIVSICWHWGTPPSGVGYESSKGKIDLNEALTEGTDLNKGMIEQMDRVAEELKKLQAAGVPVLWKPFHEFDGTWFWWGKGGPDNFIKLWQLMYDRYTNHHGLNNLVWVLGYSHEVRDNWYPGDDYVDIAGADNYSEGTQVNKYNKVASIVGTEMPIAYHENGPIPNPDDMIKDGAKWVFFMTWHTTHIMQENTPEYINAVYNHDYVITLDELPDFKTK